MHGVLLEMAGGFFGAFFATLASLVVTCLLIRSKRPRFALAHIDTNFEGGVVSVINIGDAQAVQVGGGIAKPYIRPTKKRYVPWSLPMGSTLSAAPGAVIEFHGYSQAAAASDYAIRYSDINGRLYEQRFSGSDFGRPTRLNGLRSMMRER